MVKFLFLFFQKQRDLLDLLVVGVNDALRLVDWLTAGGGGGIVGGVDWVFTSAGESGIVPTFCTLLPAMRKNRMKKKKGREVRRRTVIGMQLQSGLWGVGVVGGRWYVWAGGEKENRFSKRKTAA